MKILPLQSHNHTEHSPLDATCRLEDLVLRAKELGYKALAITDHGNIDGWWKFQKICKKHGIKPILGIEFYVDNNDPEFEKRGHLIAYAKNNTGIANIYKLKELSYTDGFYKRPQITIDMLSNYKDGLVVTSACLANIINQALLKGQYVKAKNEIERLQELFGDDFYLELQTNSLAEQHEVNSRLIEYARMLDIKLICANDTHYINKDDAFAQEVWLALGTNRKMNDPKRWKFPTNDYWFKSSDEMYDGMKRYGDIVWNMCCDNLQEIIDKCNAEIKPGKFLPNYPFLDEGETANQRLRKNALEGYNAKKDDETWLKSMNNELDVIESEGLSDYFLIVQDYIKRAENANILVGDGRGSGAGSKTCYALGITKADPDEYGLLFERFLSPGREPDIDTDFADIDAVFELLGEAYGWENVARIQSFGTLAPRKTIRDILRIFSHPTWEINQIMKLIPTDPLLKWQEVLNNAEVISILQTKYPTEFDVMKRLVGTVTNTSMHAGGIIIWTEGISSVLPCKCINNLSGKRIKRVVSFDMDDLHDLHHYKFDVLGLSTLETLQLAHKNVKKMHNIDLDFSKLNYDDEAVYDFICEGNVMGIFQLGDQAKRVIEQKPRNFKDLIAINALIRPGTGVKYFDRRNGVETDYTIMPDQISYMEETFGDYVYQEQYEMDCYIYAGWSIAFADKHVRKNKDILNDVELRERFLDDVMARGMFPYSREIADMFWFKICCAVDGGYAFNKSHSAMYARIAFQEAYIACYYPECFYSALLTKNGDKQEKVGEIINYVKRKGIKILPPDINESSDVFEPTDNGIRFRLTTISGVGDCAIKELIKLRPISSLQDLLERRTRTKLKNNNVVSLIKSGCFSCVEKGNDERLGLLKFFYESVGDKKSVGALELLQSVDPNDYKGRWELETLGLFLTEHPLDKYAFQPLYKKPEGQKSLVAGIVVEQTLKIDKNGREMAFVIIQNQYETIKLLCFAWMWNKHVEEITKVGSLICSEGLKEGTSLKAQTVELLEVM